MATDLLLLGPSVASLAWTLLCLVAFIGLRVLQQARQPSTWMQAFASPTALGLPLHATTRDALLTEYYDPPPMAVYGLALADAKPRLLHDYVVSPLLQSIVWWERAQAVPIDVSDVVMSPLLRMLSLMLPRAPNDETPPMSTRTA
ncbi:hypothetical protein SDRG_15604 [Saprolegnia diclina VS20]|uniref:Uncharacterized protein n=1 Tax=Saprolegnia diclina (strain VS20) TaxID=1156394 RepID=T0PMF8_SAPDV|nr:hypothetical protein SDRG_15604 [Saprolegnia diclina VS20]EQC26574.1 hypothetical protein SDRG_15604 [Saprolegnia diclina VS20]|eukprot:XP_008620004.1 hypothetical protein SDRG_15604 [Saprolegnia diclina VS20]